MSRFGYMALVVLGVALMLALAPGVLDPLSMGIDEQLAKQGLVTSADSDEKAQAKADAAARKEKVAPMLILAGDTVDDTGVATRRYQCANDAGKSAAEGPCANYGVAVPGSERMPIDGGAANTVVKTSTGTAGTASAAGTTSGGG